MKTEATSTKERTRKAYAPKGTTSQKMVSIRVDNDLLPWLAEQHNKGRYINDLVRADRDKKTTP